MAAWPQERRPEGKQEIEIPGVRERERERERERDLVWRQGRWSSVRNFESDLEFDKFVVVIAV